MCLCAYCVLICVFLCIYVHLCVCACACACVCWSRPPVTHGHHPSVGPSHLTITPLLAPPTCHTDHPTCSHTCNSNAQSWVSISVNDVEAASVVGSYFLLLPVLYVCVHNMWVPLSSVCLCVSLILHFLEWWFFFMLVGQLTYKIQTNHVITCPVQRLQLALHLRNFAKVRPFLMKQDAEKNHKEIRTHIELCC